MMNRVEKPVVKEGQLYCPHCEWRLKPNGAGAVCGICGTIYQREDIVDLQVKALGPSPNSESQLKRAHEILAAQENVESEIEIVAIRNHKMSAAKNFLSLLGLPVEEHDYPTREPAYISLAFVFICFAVQFSSEAFKLNWAVDPMHLGHLGGLNFLTYSFVHAGVWHIAANLFFLWPFMDNVEDHLGHFNTLLLFVSASVGSAALHLAGDSSNLPLVGASGVCFAFATLYCLRYPRNRFLMAVPLVGLIAYPWRVRLRARSLLAYYVVIEIYKSSAQTQGLTKVSHLGHLGGVTVGLLFYYLFKGSSDSEFQSPA